MQAREARGDHIASLHGIGRYAQHARQIVAPASGQHAQQGARDLTQDFRHRADHPIAAETHDRLAARSRLARKLPGMIEVPRELAAHAEAMAPQGARHRRQRPARFAAAGSRVHDQAQTLAHHASVLGRALTVGPRLGEPPSAREQHEQATLDRARHARPSVLGIAKTRLRTCEHRPWRLTARLCCRRCPLASPLRVCWSAPEPRRWACS